MAGGDPGLALVTGASGGIGAELARAFAEAGHPLVLAARSEESLAAVADELRGRHGTTVDIVALDLGQHDAPGRLQAELQRRGHEVCHLVNNAGFGLARPFAEGDLEEQLALVDLNIRALTELTHRFLPGMLEARRGGVLNVASTAAFLPGPYMATYYASKAYVLSFSRALAEETKRSGVTVTALCPGPVRTGFQARAGMANSPMMRMMPAKSARSVAEAGFRAYRRGRPVCLPGAVNSLSARGSRVLPSSIAVAVTGWMNRGRS